MSGFKARHWLILALTGVVIVLLLLAPHHSGKFEGENAMADQNEPPTTEFEIDSALQLISGAQPMQGILMLRDIAAEHPENFRAQYHLGRFSAQTGQWEKVIERFNIVQQIDPEFIEAEYWLGIASMNLGQTEVARTHLNTFVSNDQNNPQLRVDAERMLSEIDNVDPGSEPVEAEAEKMLN